MKYLILALLLSFTTACAHSFGERQGDLDGFAYLADKWGDHPQAEQAQTCQLVTVYDVYGNPLIRKRCY